MRAVEIKIMTSFGLRRGQLHLLMDSLHLLMDSLCFLTDSLHFLMDSLPLPKNKSFYLRRWGRQLCHSLNRVYR